MKHKVMFDSNILIELSKNSIDPVEFAAAYTRSLRNIRAGQGAAPSKGKFTDTGDLPAAYRLQVFKVFE